MYGCHHTRSLPPFVLAACLVVSFLFNFISCNGNGGGADYEGAVYGAPAESGSGSSSSSSAGTGGGSISAEDMLNLSNAGDTDSIISRLEEPSASSQSEFEPSTIALSASDIGLPAGGYVTLTITGDGIGYAADASASSDGNVYFQIPPIEEGSEITVSVIVKRPSGTVVCAGSKTQTVVGGASHISISLLQGDVWQLPVPLTVNASSTSVIYDVSGAAGQSVTFSVAGLTAPEYGSLSYSWALADGTPAGDGESVTVALDDLLGGAPSSGGSYTPAVTVTATYTDEDGVTSTSSGTGLVTVTVLEIPAFTIEITPPDTGTVAHAGGPGYDVGDLSQPFTYKAVPVSGAFPEGTVFTWSRDGGATSLSESSGTLSASPADWGCASWATVSTVEYDMTCRAENPRALGSPQSAGPVNLKLYKALSPPLLEVSSNGTAVAGAEATYIAVSNTDMSKTTLSLGISNSADMPAGTTLVYTVNGMDINGTPGSQSITRLGSVGYSALPESVIISCTAKCPGYDDVAGDPVTVYFLPRIPPFEVTLDISIPPATAVADGSGGSVKVHYLSATHLPTETDTLGTGLFTFSATPVAVPAGTTADDFAASGYSYDWTVDGVSLGTDFDDGTVDLHLPNLGITDIASMPTVRTNYTIGCKVSRADSGEELEETYTLILEPKLHTVCFMSNSSTVAATLPVLDGSSIWDGTKADGKSLWDDSKASPPVISSTNGVFDGWYTDDTLTTPFFLGAAVTADADAYARWQTVDVEKRNPDPPDFINTSGRDITYLFEVKDQDYERDLYSWSTAIKILNSTHGTTSTVYMDIQGDNKSIASNHGGIKICGPEGVSDVGGKVKLIFTTSSSGTLTLGFHDYGTHGNIQAERVEDCIITVDPSCTASNMKSVRQSSGAEFSYSSFASFLSAAQANTDNDVLFVFTIRRN